MLNLIFSLFSLFNWRRNFLVFTKLRGSSTPLSTRSRDKCLEPEVGFRDRGKVSSRAKTKRNEIRIRGAKRRYSELTRRATFDHHRCLRLKLSRGSFRANEAAVPNWGEAIRNTGTDGNFLTRPDIFHHPSFHWTTPLRDG